MIGFVEIQTPPRLAWLDSLGCKTHSATCSDRRSLWGAILISFFCPNIRSWRHKRSL